MLPVPTEPTGDERTALLNRLASARGALRRTLHGLTEKQAASTPTAGALSLSGLVKHVAFGERSWLGRMQGVQRDPAEAAAEWASSFALDGEETIDSVLARYARVAADTETAVRAAPSLDATFHCPPTSWDAGGDRSWRWALLHIIDETARHTGHADIIRETLDGKTAYELDAEAPAF